MEGVLTATREQQNAHSSWKEKNKMATASTGAGGHVGKDDQHGIGSLFSLDKFQFKSGMKDAGEAYKNTITVLADAAGVEFSWDMMLLIKNLKEPHTFKESDKPVAPRKKQDQDLSSELAKYKGNLDTFQKEKDRYNDHKAKLFLVIKKLCSDDLRTKIEGDNKYKNLEKDKIVVGLLKLIKSKVHAKDMQHPCVMLLKLWKHYQRGLC